MVNRNINSKRSGHFALYDLWDHRRWAPAVIPKPDAQTKNSVHRAVYSLVCSVTRYQRPMRKPACRNSWAKKSGHRICGRNSSLVASLCFGSIWLLLSSLLLTRFALVPELTIRCCTVDDAVLGGEVEVLLLHWWLVGATTVGSAISGAIILSV